MKTTTRITIALIQATIATLSMIQTYYLAANTNTQELKIIPAALLMGILTTITIIAYFSSYLNLKKATEEIKQCKKTQE
jgi:hypothetical protein